MAKADRCLSLRRSPSGAKERERENRSPEPTASYCRDRRLRPFIPEVMGSDDGRDTDGRVIQKHMSNEIHIN